MDILDSSTFKSKPRKVPGGPKLMRILEVLVRLDIIPNYPLKPKDISISQISDFCKKFSYKKVLIVGSNPSQKSPDLSAFHESTKSRKTIDGWFGDDGWYVAYDNLVDFQTENNKPLSKAELDANMSWIEENMRQWKRLGYKIVACGKGASRGLKLAKVEHFEMPHPSGLCRFWNNKEKAQAKIEEMKAWILE